MIKEFNLTNSSNIVKLLFASIVIFGWLYQFVGHQIWRYIPHLNHGKVGLLIVSLGIAVLAIPFFRFNFHKIISNSYLSGYKRLDIIFLFGLLIATLIFWWFIAYPWVNLPMHAHGDEWGHNLRVTLEYNYWKDVLHFSFPDAWFISYPALAYPPIILISKLLGNVGSIEYQRIALLIWVIPIPLFAYAIGRLLNINRLQICLLSMILASSPLLLSSTVSFYIELPYISLELIAIFWLIIADKYEDGYALCLAIGFASLATLVRESMLPFAFSIMCACLYINHSKTTLFSNFPKWLSNSWIIAAAIGPGLFFCFAQKQYDPHHDLGRLAFKYLFMQDWWLLIKYTPFYLNIGIVIFALITLLRVQQSYKIVVLTALSAIIISLIMYGMFLPGWMPWSRNYILFFAMMVVLALNGIAVCQDKIRPLLINGLLVVAIISNILIGAFFFKDNRFFHENEAIFDTLPAYKALELLRKSITLYTVQPDWMSWNPAMHAEIPQNIKLIKLKSDGNSFLPFAQIEALLPWNAQFVLYYYYENGALEPAIRNLTDAPKNQMFNQNFNIILVTDDPFSNGRIGVALLEKK